MTRRRGSAAAEGDCRPRLHALLLDLDGTLYIGNSLIPGATDAIEQLRKANIPLRFTTNTTTKSNASLIAKLRNLGIDAVDSELFGAVSATVAHLRSLDSPPVRLLLSDDPKADFTEFTIDDSNPGAIVVGDMAKAWDQPLMQSCFEQMQNGAHLIAMHKGKYWQTESGLRVDIGAFISGLEFVTGVEATVIGKPSKSFFDLAVASLGIPSTEVMMVGDDIESDIGGAQQAGLTGVLVRTGKYRPETERDSDVLPDHVIDSIADLPSLFEQGLV